MSKFKYSFYISLAFLISIIVYSFILFLLVENRNNVFYISYGFSLFSFIAFWLSTLSVLIKPRNLDESFLNEPYMSVSLLYFIAQMVFGIWSIITGYISIKLVISIDILLFGIYTVCMLFLVVGITMNKTIEKENIETKLFIKELSLTLSGLVFETSSVHEAYLQLMEDIKFSSPSSNKSKDIEQQINELSVLFLENKESQEVNQYISKIHQLIKKRNILLKN